ncbi:MAG: hypothetical protein ASARMPREDX12_003448 [Alectoria sarmentosa]|nr:MAG: hypothetical protein ASARMPREDX12_003448 [Alectoria sarmentosa]
MIDRHQHSGPGGRLPHDDFYEQSHEYAFRNREDNHRRAPLRPHSGTASPGVIVSAGEEELLTRTQTMVNTRKTSGVSATLGRMMGFSLWSTNAPNPMHILLTSLQAIPKPILTASPIVSVEDNHESIFDFKRDN